MSSRSWSPEVVVVGQVAVLLVVDDASTFSEPPIDFSSRFASSRMEDMDSLLGLD